MRYSLPTSQRGSTTVATRSLHVFLRQTARKDELLPTMQGKTGGTEQKETKNVYNTRDSLIVTDPTTTRLLLDARGEPRGNDIQPELTDGVVMQAAVSSCNQPQPSHNQDPVTVLAHLPPNLQSLRLELPTYGYTVPDCTGFMADYSWWQLLT